MQNWVLQENNLLGDPALLFVTNQTGLGGGAPGQGLRVAAGISPNPASGPFSVYWSMPEPAGFTLSVFDVTGRLVRTITQEASASSGMTVLDGLSDGGAPMASGCYLVRLDTAAGSGSSSMVYLGR